MSVSVNVFAVTAEELSDCKASSCHVIFPYLFASVCISINKTNSSVVEPFENFPVNCF